EEVRRIGEIELLDWRPVVRAAGFVGMDEFGGIAEGQRRGDAEREALAWRAGDIDLAQAKAGVAVVDIEGAPDVVNGEMFAAGRRVRGDRPAAASLGRAGIDAVVPVYESGDRDGSRSRGRRSRRGRRLGGFGVVWLGCVLRVGGERRQAKQRA